MPPENDLGLVGAECCRVGVPDVGGLLFPLSLEKKDRGLSGPDENDLGLDGDTERLSCRRFDPSSEDTDLGVFGVMGRIVGFCFAVDLGVLGAAGGLFVFGDGACLAGLGTCELCGEDTSDDGLGLPASSCRCCLSLS